MLERRGKWPFILAVSLSLAADVLATACSRRTCSNDARIGLAITIRDARTDAPVCDANVVASDGNYHAQLDTYNVDPCAYFGAIERPGTYRLDVSRDGYLSTGLDGLTVSQEDECHIAGPVERTVYLQRDPNGPPDRDAASD